MAADLERVLDAERPAVHPLALFRRRATAKGKDVAQELIGESEIRLYSAHELSVMLRPERWSRVELYGGLDGAPFSLDAPRLVLVAWK